MNLSCTQVQEEIAWGKNLTEEAQSHIFGCINCGKLALEFTTLDALVNRDLDIEIPLDFVERVMLRIEGKEMISTSEWSSRFADWIQLSLGLRPVQLGMVYAAVLIAFLNVFRFVMGVILPAVT